MHHGRSLAILINQRKCAVADTIDCVWSCLTLMTCFARDRKERNRTVCQKLGQGIARSLQTRLLLRREAWFVQTVWRIGMVTQLVSQAWCRSLHDHWYSRELCVGRC